MSKDRAQKSAPERDRKRGRTQCTVRINTNNMTAQREEAYTEWKRKICQAINWQSLLRLPVPDTPPEHSFSVQVLTESVWVRKYATIFSGDLNHVRRAGAYIEFEHIRASTSARPLGEAGAVIVHCAIKRDIPRCRDPLEARLPQPEHLVLTAGRSGPAILLPHCTREYIRPHERGHQDVCEYLYTFGDIVPVHGVALAELQVWTTTSRALLIGKFDRFSQQQQDLIQSTICDTRDSTGGMRPWDTTSPIVSTEEYALSGSIL